MPLAALLLDKDESILKYEKSLENKVIKIETYIIPQPEDKVLFIVIYPIFYVCEWAIFNGFFRYMMKKGLKKQGYTKAMMPVNRFELTQKLIHNGRRT